MSDRIDPETGRVVRPGQMTAAEFRAWYQRMRAGWRAALCDPSCPPDDSGRWAWCGAEIGWIRRKETRA